MKFEAVIHEAAILMSGHGENVEYDRALVEITTFLAGGTSDDLEKTRAVLVNVRDEKLSKSEAATRLLDDAEEPRGERC